MAVKPKNVKLNIENSVPDIMNAIKNDASPAYKAAVPYAVSSTESARTVGAAINSSGTFKNEFLSALYNRIARVIITSKMYENPYSFVKKGILETGEFVEEIFVNLCQPFEFSPEAAETNVFKRAIPDVRAKLHAMDYQKFYKQTISDKQLKTAFVSWAEVGRLIAGIVDAMYTSANYDEFLAIKYMIGQRVLDGTITPINVGAGTTKDDLENNVATINAVSNLLTFESSNYNEAGVYNFTPKENQYFFISAKTQAAYGTKVLAAAFNLSEVEFMGHMVLVDSFGELDIARLSTLFGDDPNYVEPSADDLKKLSNIPGVIVDLDWFQIYDNLVEFTEIYNAEGLYWNYFLHVWKTLSVSPFANAVLLVNGEPTVNSVAVTPSTATIRVGESLQLSATVTGDFFPANRVTWSSNSTDVTVDNNGMITGVVAGSGGVTITATSVADPTKTGTATITVTA